ncbi:MAG TPA: alpha/beta fold hydrolase [Ktedonobacteraceae bacterium]|nr:alpha/beta fold hydrolase [Ktedonobacteraceae bacterium]
MAIPNNSQAAKVGVLLIHGLNGNRHDMEELADFLTLHDMIAENMLLPGHGLHVRELMPLGWSDWAEAVYSELRALKQRCDVVFLVGHSLGGALALHVAAHEDVGGVVAMCAPLHLHPMTRYAVRVAKYITPLLPTVREDVRDPAARRRYTRDVYRWTPMRPVESMLQFLPTLRSELPRITVPALVMTSIHDHVVPARDGREIYRQLGSREKHLVTFHRSYHVIMKDHDRDEVFTKTYAFIRQHANNIQLRHLAPLTDEQSDREQTA